MISKEHFLKILEPRDLMLGGAFIVLLVLGTVAQSSIYKNVDTSVCALEDFAKDAYAAWNSKQKIAHSACYQELFRGMSRTETRAYQREYEALMAAEHPRMGYKIGIHEPSQQAMMGLDGSVFGVFYGKEAFHKSGAIIDVQGENLNFEPDLLLRVGDERINEAKTIEEAAKYIDRVYAFIELPALLTNEEELRSEALFPDFAMMQAANLMARYGVIGDYIDTSDDPNIIENIQNMVVFFNDHEGNVATPYSVEIEFHNPFVTAIHTAEFLAERNEKLEVGDLISVGAMTVFMGNRLEFELPGIDNEMRHVHYLIGDKMLHVAVGFEDSVRGTSYE